MRRFKRYRGFIRFTTFALAGFGGQGEKFLINSSFLNLKAK